MRAVRRTLALGAFALMLAAGCASPYPDRIPASSRIPPPTASQQPPAWVAAGAAPLPAASTASSIPPPDSLAAQQSPTLGVPRVEEERSLANHSAEELVPAVTPVSAVSPSGPIGPISPVGPIGPTSPIVEPNWKPAGGFRAP